jgi:thioredoxin-related protein
VLRSFAILFSLTAIGAGALAAKPEYPAMGNDIFDAKVSAETLISDAVTLANREDKKVLLFFGANWCPWCRRLHAALSKDPAIQARLSQKFVLVYVDANTRNDRNRNAGVLAKYGDPVKQYGLPVLLLLDRNGNPLTTRETDSLAADSDQEVAVRVRAVLGEWSK